MRDLWKLLAYLAEDLVPFLSHSNSPEALDFIEKNGLIYQQFNTIAAVRVWQWPLKCHQLSIISTDWIAKNPTSSCRFIGSERSLFYCLSLLLNNTRYKHARKNKRLKLVPSSGSLLNESNRRIKEIDGYEQLDFPSERWQQLFKDFCQDYFWKRKKKKKKRWADQGPVDWFSSSRFKFKSAFILFLLGFPLPWTLIALKNSIARIDWPNEIDTNGGEKSAVTSTGNRPTSADRINNQRVESNNNGV